MRNLIIETFTYEMRLTRLWRRGLCSFFWIAANFKEHFGRGPFFRPCTNEDPCNGDFDCDIDVDGTDAAVFKSDFGRSQFLNPCPACIVGDWCVYE